MLLSREERHQFSNIGLEIFPDTDLHRYPQEVEPMKPDTKDDQACQIANHPPHQGLTPPGGSRRAWTPPTLRNYPLKGYTENIYGVKSDTNAATTS